MKYYLITFLLFILISLIVLNVFFQPMAFTIKASTGSLCSGLVLPQSNEQFLFICVDSMKDYNLSLGNTSDIENFTASYRIETMCLAPCLDLFDKSRNLITSTILKDFNNMFDTSKIKIYASTENQSSVTNFAASKYAINDKIKEQISNNIDDVLSEFGTSARIICNFGMSLSKYNCTNVVFMD